MTQIYFENGWYGVELNKETKKEFIWSSEECYIYIENPTDSVLVFDFFNDYKKSINFSIYLKEPNKDFNLFLNSNIEPQKLIKIKIPIKNLEKIKIKSEFFRPNNTDTRKLGLMLCDMFLRKEDKHTRIFLSNLKNHKNKFLGDISNYIKNKKLINNQNNLESVCLLLTGDEFEKKLFDHFKSQINKTNTDITKKIDFNVLLKNNDKNQYELDFLNNFRSVNIIKLDVPIQYDFYSKKDEIFDYKYGKFSGPNYVFFNAFEHLKKYNTTLFLECDCFLSEDWIDKIYNYVKFSGGFWVSGAVYDGVNNDVLDSLLNSHINGGTCLYKTSDESFQDFIKFCFDMLPIFVKLHNENMPYDFYIKFLIDYHFDHDLKNRSIWQFIRRLYTKNNLITNYSTKNDIKEDVEKIFEKYNCAVIHKKPF